MSDAPKDPLEIVNERLAVALVGGAAPRVAWLIVSALHDAGWRFVHADNRREFVSYRATEIVREEAGS